MAQITDGNQGDLEVTLKLSAELWETSRAAHHDPTEFLNIFFSKKVLRKVYRPIQAPIVPSKTLGEKKNASSFFLDTLLYAGLNYESLA